MQTTRTAMIRGELRAAFLERRSKSRQLVCFNPDTGFLSGEQMHMCRLGNEEGGGRRYGRDRKGERQLWSTTLCCISSPCLQVSLPLLPKYFLPSFARGFAARKKVLHEHRVLILPGSPSVLEKKNAENKILKDLTNKQTKISGKNSAGLNKEMNSPNYHKMLPKSDSISWSRCVQIIFPQPPACVGRFQHQPLMLKST